MASMGTQIYPQRSSSHFCALVLYAFPCFLRHPDIDPAQPPRSTALVTEMLSTEQPRTILVPESTLQLRDRELAVGDVVKRDPRDPISGTVVAVDINVYLLPPRPWSEALPWTDTPPRSWDTTCTVGPISASDLSWPPHLEVSDIIIYQDKFVGRVMDCWQDVTIRLSNGSVVIPEDEDRVTPIYSSLACEVGDRVHTKKSNLRKGRWIFGSYDPNIEPVGVVLNLETTSVTVAWMADASEGVIPGDGPDEVLDRDVLQSGDVHVYDHQRAPRGFTPNVHTSEPRDRCRLDVKTCDVVKFHDLQAACEHYNKDSRLASGPGKTALRRIPRQETLGYDVNWFMVAHKETTVHVRWQDLSESDILAREVVPTLDLDDDEDVWPGEIVCTRAAKDEHPTTYCPKRVGVVQAVNAKDRLAKVAWFEGAVAVPNDDNTLLLPGSWTGNLEPEPEECSLYDIWTLPAVTRRPGDFVTLSKMHRIAMTDAQIAVREQYHELERLIADRGSSCIIVGEIVNLGLDGLLQVRLGASAIVTDVKVPIECTQVMHMDDWSEDPMDGGDDDQLNLLAQTQAALEQARAAMSQESREALDLQEASWLDENQVPVDAILDDEWEDELDEDDSPAVQPSPRVPPGNASDLYRSGWPLSDQLLPPISFGQVTVQAVNHTEAGAVAGGGDASGRMANEAPSQDPSPSDHISLFDPTFTYATMLDGLMPGKRPQSMMILEGAAPLDHHFSGSRSERAITGTMLRRIQKEIGMLDGGLPEGVFVRTWEQAIDLFRFVFVGPLDTPYEYVPVVIDIHLHSEWPNVPPKTFFHSWTDGSAPINPNLYEDGKICLSLLGTWPGEEQQQGWMPTSTILQLVVSILGLVLVKEPYYNEAGFEVRAGAVEARIPSALYSERTYFRSRSFIKHAIGTPIGGFEDVIDTLYKPSDEGPNLLIRAIWSAAVVLDRSKQAASEQDYTAVEGRTVSRGALHPLRREIVALISAMDEQNRQTLMAWLDGGPMPTGGPGGIFTSLASISAATS